MIEETTPPIPLTDGANLLENTGEFILSLMQAFLRTGYYLSDHPESKKAKSGLFEKFAAITKNSGEITFLITEESGQRTIVVEGIDEKPLRLQSLMLRGMAETYTPRFINFLNRKELLSLSLNSRMNSEEFSRFIDVMSEPALADMEGAPAKVLFAETLRERGICNLSFIFREDFIIVRDKLPWRTRMALSRLKKDVHMLPVFRDLAGEELQRAKRQTLTDILRPLGAADLVYSFLINLDLAASSFLSEEDGEDAVFNTISEKLLAAVGVLFLQDASGKGDGFPEHVTPHKKARLLGKLCQRLHHSQEPQAGVILVNLFDLGIITLEQLPDALRVRVLTIKRMTNFLLAKDKLLSSFDKTYEQDIYRPRALTMSGLVPYLIEGGKYEEAAAIVRLIVEHSREQSDRAESAKKIVAAIAEGPSLALAATAFLSTAKETRSIISQLFLLLGQAAFPHLHSILVETDDIWCGKQAVDLLLSMGSEAALTLIQLIDEGKLPAESIPLAIRQLGEAAEGTLKLGAIRIMDRMVNDDRPHIRREALSALIRLQPLGRFAVFSRNLADPDIRVRKVAIRGIGLTGDPKAFDSLTRVIETADKSGREDDYGLAALAIEGLGGIMENCREMRGKAFGYLAQLVDKICPRGTWKKIISGTLGFPPSVALSLVETLGRQTEAGTSELLTRLAQHRDPAVARRAADLARETGRGKG